MERHLKYLRGAHINLGQKLLGLIFKISTLGYRWLNWSGDLTDFSKSNTKLQVLDTVLTPNVTSSNSIKKLLFKRVDFVTQPLCFSTIHKRYVWREVIWKSMDQRIGRWLLQLSMVKNYGSLPTYYCIDNCILISLNSNLPIVVFFMVFLHVATSTNTYSFSWITHCFHKNSNSWYLSLPMSGGL